MVSSSIVSTQTSARKRRKEILASQKMAKRQRCESEDGEERDNNLCRNEHIIPANSTSPSKESRQSRRTKNKVTSRAKVAQSYTKYQNRYDPGVQMSKEEEAEWRREARRQRNRESAANSRNKVRNRIQELEKEVIDWEGKYASLMKRIELLEKSALASKTIDIPSCVSTGSEEHQELSTPLVSSCPSSNNIISPIEQQSQSIAQQNVTNDEDHHVIEIISRPAVSRQ
jgi:hypothetical protein